MAKKKYIVSLTAEEREELEQLSKTPTVVPALMALLQDFSPRHQQKY